MTKNLLSLKGSHFISSILYICVEVYPSDRCGEKLLLTGVIVYIIVAEYSPFENK